jgi:acyl carrier protein
MKEKIKSIISQVKEGVNLQDISYETDLISEIGFDSLEMINIVALLEDEFDCEFDYDNLNLSNFRSINLIEKLLLNN